MKCFYCDKDIDGNSDRLKIIALDRPYANIPVHRDTCYLEIQSYGEEKYLRENIERIIALSNRPVETHKKRRTK